MNDPRAELPVGMQTVKSRLISAAVDHLRAAAFLSPHVPIANVVNDYTGVKLFEFVDPGVLDDIMQSQTPAARVEEGEELVGELMYPITEKTLRLYVHFKVVNVLGVDRGPLINYYFGRITEILVTADHFAGIALDITEVGNTPQTQGMNDPEPGGSIWYDVQYRHGHGNFFSETGNG